jgi:predicted DNA-binding ribbon-helix-helix protein
MIIDPFYWTQPQPRIVQHQKRRYALRLESIFWQQLEKIAQKRGRRLGQVVAELADVYDGKNLSSFVRGYCMVEAERENTHYRLSAGSFDLLDVLRACPAPAILLNSDRVIIETNHALARWSAPQAPGSAEIMLRQRKFDDVFIPRIGKPLAETVAMMQSGELKRAQFQVTYDIPNEPSRTVMATMTGLPVGSIFYVLVWLTVNASYRITTNK